MYKTLFQRQINKVYYKFKLSSYSVRSNSTRQQSNTIAIDDSVSLKV